ncbi:cation:proton antiporter subunit C [Natrinema versiforme]|uniref:NADH-ubiquinone oxidoreductase chain 4L n=1 Tax=Natrinema versiforme JCM 10478 TaxID=1227496 RepID=L9Y0C8_9EURY|nr:cation:proton antiporter subunit C [Natrinema versiforme]ELY67177.1 NADH-ubiquinone oxidoreductase chain 4L [Natrinema versiforme JCM 10478]
MIELLMDRYTYVLMFVLLGLGIYMVIASENLVKKLIGVSLFQTAIFLFFISMAYIDVEGASAPIVPHHGEPGEVMVASPLPQVIVLTAIVVGIALTAVGLALIIRIYAEYGTLREDTLREVRADE